MAAAVCLLITTEAFNPFACDCKNDKKGGGKPDNGLPPVIEAEVTCMCSMMQFLKRFTET